MNHNDAPTMQSYPSPNATAADSSGGPFYGPNSSNPHPNQHQQHLPTPDELQLAEQLSADAQLSRSIQPNMGANRGMSENPDSRSQGNVNMNHQYQPDHQMHGGHAPVNHGLMEVGPQYEDDSISPAGRKRSKVSRACDECRRKKIRCNANEPGNEDICSNCKRVGVHCQFSRQPMKRGPSKGYIKELADRINTLEGQVQGSEMPQYQQSQEILQRRPSEEFSPTPNPEQLPRKRGYSSISGVGEFNSPYQNQQRSASNWIPQEQPRSSISNSSYPTSAPLPGTTQLPTREQTYSPNMTVPQQKWVNAPDVSGSVEAVNHTSQPHSEDPVEYIDDSLLENYYKFIHPTYPILSLTKARLISRLSACPAPVRHAFWEALHAAIRSFPTAVPLKPRGITNAVRIIQAVQYDSQTIRSPTTTIVHLQIMMLLAIEANNLPCDIQDGQIIQLPSVWLSTAVGFAYSTKLHAHKPIDKSNNDPDSDDKHARRVWFSLVIMERWNAAVRACPIQIPDSVAQIYPDDRVILGEVTYHLVRIAVVIGNYAEVNIATNDLPPLAVHRGLHSRLLKTQLELVRHELSNSGITPIDSPVLHINYWCAYLLILLLQEPQEDADEQMRATHYIISQLSFNPDLKSPLVNYYKCFAALALPNLLQIENTKKEAESTLKTILEGRLASSPWDKVTREFLINNLGAQRRGSIGLSQSQSQGAQQLTSAVMNAKADDNQHMITAANQGLQRLADLATAETEDRVEVSSGVSTAEVVRNDKDGSFPSGGLNKV